MRRMASWETPWMSMASCVIVLWMISLTVCGDILGESSNSNLELPSIWPCPEPEHIAPCKCTFDLTLAMYMDCSDVANEDELSMVFSNNFTFTHFFRLLIYNNYNITTLREGDLGSATFTEIDITYTSLIKIEDDALTDSLDTLLKLTLYENSLESLPDISPFYNLTHLYAYNNRLTRFPDVASATLLYLDLSFNLIDDVPKDAIIATPLLTTLIVDGNSLTEIHSDTFSQNEKLFALGLSSNKLTTIPDDAITLHELRGKGTYLDLHANQITSLTYEAVTSVTGHLWIYNNDLTEVPESVFRPLLENDVEVQIYENPFKCGCDMAWLVLNQTLLNKLENLEEFIPTCIDGEYFTDLDPETYKVMCPNATAVPLELQ